MANRKNWVGILTAVLVFGLVFSGCGTLITFAKPSEELPNSYEVETGEIKDIDGDIKTEKINLVNLPKGVKHRNNSAGETVEQISVLKSGRDGNNAYFFMTEYPRHCLHIKIDNAPSVEMVSDKRDGEIVLVNTLFPISSDMLESLKKCGALVLQAENVKYKNETVDYMSAIMPVEPEGIEALHKLLQ